MMNMFFETLRRFKKEEDGTAAIELLYAVPMISWALLSTYVYFDAYRVEANVNRASLTLAEMFSRESVPITEAYIDGTENILRALTISERTPEFRVTVYQFMAGSGEYRVVWSRHRGMARELEDSDLAAIKDILPIQNPLDHSILVETTVDYAKPFAVGMGDFNRADRDDVTFNTYTVIRPRQSRLCFDEIPADPTLGVICTPP